MKKQYYFKLFAAISISVLTSFAGLGQVLPYQIVDTDVQDFYNNSAITSAPLLSSITRIRQVLKQGQGISK